MDFNRRKRVTGPFNDEAKARLVGVDHRQLSYGSSGSEHSGAGDGDGDSPCLSELVHHFLEDNNGNENENDSVPDEFDSERVDSVLDCIDSVEDILKLNATNNTDPYRNILYSHVSEAVNKFAFMREQNASSFRRNVMSFLREKGHNAAICKTRWDSSNGVTAGSHEFIDVVKSAPYTCQNNNRYFVELDFAGQFEIARPTSKYSEILGNIPGIFVGNGEVLKRSVLAMCEVAKRCLRSRGLSVPPWRKNRFMQKKWFGPYKRTTNPVHGNPVPDAVVSGLAAGAKCRMVGFNDAVSEEARRGGVFVPTR